MARTRPAAVRIAETSSTNGSAPSTLAWPQISNGSPSVSWSSITTAATGPRWIAALASTSPVVGSTAYPRGPSVDASTSDQRGVASVTTILCPTTACIVSS